jgi:hypothetical protein
MSNPTHDTNDAGGREMPLTADSLISDVARGGGLGAAIASDLQAYKERAKQLKSDLEMAGGCLNMVRDRLIAVGCCCKEPDHGATPPMMYDDWISCAVAKRELELARLRAFVASLKAKAQQSIIILPRHFEAFERGETGPPVDNSGKTDLST